MSARPSAPQDLQSKQPGPDLPRTVSRNARELIRAYIHPCSGTQLQACSFAWYSLANLVVTRRELRTLNLSLAVRSSTWRLVHIVLWTYKPAVQCNRSRRVKVR